MTQWTELVAAPVLTGSFALLAVLVQRGRRETTDRFDNIARQLRELSEEVKGVKQVQHHAAVERAVLRNEVDTIKERHALVDMFKRQGTHRGSRRFGLWVLATLMRLRLYN